MATVITDDKHYKDIAAKIREKVETDGVYKPAEMATGVESVYSKAYENGHTDGYVEGNLSGREEGYNNGYANGAQSEYDRFWDAFQDYGNRTDYAWAFRRWNTDYIRPKYKVKNIATKSESFFQYSTVKKIEAAYFDFAGIDSITGQSSGAAYTLFNACRQLEEIEDLNIPAVDYAYTWYNCVSLKKIAVVRCAAGKTFISAFGNCEALEDVTFTGVVSTNGLDLRYSTKLNRASIESVINVLSPSTSKLTVTLSKAAVNSAFEDGVNSNEWKALIETKSNWTISLV